MTRMIVFTDLDGTFLDHETYDWKPAQPALERLDAQNIPVIFVTSKTFAEVQDLQKDTGIYTPCIVENGAGIHVPEHYFPDIGEDKITLGLSRTEILRGFKNLPENLRAHITGFSDMGPSGIAKATNMSEAHSEKANTRIGSEPFLWLGDDEEFQTLEKMLGAQKIKILRGGRFFHAMGQHDKADGVKYLLERYKRLWDTDDIITLALGDGPNDREMLQSVDYASIIPNEKGVELNGIQGRKSTVHARLPGPAGWNDSVLGLLNTLDMR